MSIYDVVDAVPNHPAACPYCGGTRVNEGCLDGQIRPLCLNADGTVTCGEMSDGFDFSGPITLYCWGCSSTYILPAAVKETFDDKLQYEDALSHENPTKDEPGYIGNNVTYLAVPQIHGEDDAVHAALKAMLVCTLDSGLSGWMREHDPMALAQLQDAIDNLQNVLRLNGQDTVDLQRTT